MDDPATLVSDEQTMRRCFALAALSARDGGYPFAAIVTKKGITIAEATNRVSQDRDVTQKPLR